MKRKPRKKTECVFEDIASSVLFTSVRRYRGFGVSSKFGRDLGMITLSHCMALCPASVHSLHWFVPGTKMDRFQVILSLLVRLWLLSIVSSW